MVGEHHIPFCMKLFCMVVVLYVQGEWRMNPLGDWELWISFTGACVLCISLSIVVYM